MAENQQITVEDLSPTPLQPIVEEEQQQETEVPAEAPAVEQAPVDEPEVGGEGFVVPPRPADPDRVLSEAEQEGVRVELFPEEAPMDSESGTEPLVAPQYAYDQQAITAGPSVTPAPTTIDGNPILPPARFEDRASDPNLSDDEFLRIKKESYDFYYDQILGGNGDPEKRMNAINRATYYRVPVIDQKTLEIVRDERGNVVYDSDPIPFISEDPEMRVIQLFELARSNNGFYHFFDGDPKDTSTQTFGQLDIGLAKMIRGDQSPLTSFFYRVESEEGGMRNYAGILKDAGINDPARLTYLARHQAQSGPLSGIELTRMGGGIRDTFKFLADIGFGEGFPVPFTDSRVGLGAPLVEFTATIPFYLYEAASLSRWNPFSEETPYQDIIESDVPKKIRQIMQGGISPWQMDDAVSALKKEYPHATETQIEAIMAYSPDLLTLSKRWAIESLATSGGMLSILRGVDKTERANFIDHVRGVLDQKDFTQGTWAELAKESPSDLKNVEDALLALEKSGLSRTDVLKQYYEKQGLSGATSNLLAKSFDFDMGIASTRKGPYYDEVIAPNLERAKKELSDVNAKIDVAIERNNEDLIKSLSARKMLIQKDINSYTEISYTPKWMRQYLKEEAIATGVAATAYQAVYDVAGENPTTASLAAFAFGVSTAFPGVRDTTVNTVADVTRALRSNLNSEQSKAAIRIKRHLEKAPPELREQILLFMEKRAIAIEELSALTFPKGHPKAGQPVLEKGLLDQSFAQMSGLVSLKRLEKDIMASNVDIQKDAGRLSQNLLDLEKNYVQQAKLMDSLAQSIDAMRYVRFADGYNPSTDSAQMTNFLISFYEKGLDDLTSRRGRLEDALTTRDRDMNRFMTGLMDPDDLEGYLDGTKQFSDLIALDRARYVELGLSPDATLAEKAQALQGYYVSLNGRLAEAFKANNRFTFDADQNAQTANNQFRAFVTAQESSAYSKASEKFDQLRANPLYKDTRMDVTDVVTSFIAQGADGSLGLNVDALSNVMKIYGEGTQSSRYLAGLNLPSPIVRGLTGLFGEAAGEYLDDLASKIDQKTLDAIYAKADIKDDATELDRWFAVKNYFDANKDKFGDQYDDLYPRLGVDPATLMHVVSGLGDRGARSGAARELRTDLLNRAKTEFYDNFYNPKTERKTVPGFAEDYEKVRAFYNETYIIPFREESGVVASIVRNPDTKIRRNALTETLKELAAADVGTDLPRLKENFYTVLEGIIGEKIDVKTPKGEAIRAILTKHVHAEIARMPGSLALRDELVRDATTEAGPLIRAQRAAEIEKAIASGADTPLLNNLTRRNSETGEYLFADVNGEPLIDPSVNGTLGFDELLGHGIEDAQRALLEVNNRVADERTAMLRRFDTKGTKERKELEARQSLTKSLRANNKGLGSALLDLTGTTGGLEEIAQIRQDFIYGLKLDGASVDEAGAIFDDVVKDATLDHIMTQITEPGAELPMRTVDPKTGEQRMAVHRAVEMRLNKLAELLGIRGDTVTESPRAKAMRTLVGKETYDHMRFVFEELYQYDPKTGALNITGTSVPLSAESMLSRATSFARGVISLRWLVSEAAIRSSRESNYALTKLMLGDPQVGREVLDMMTSKNFNLDKREPMFMPILISQMAKNDALQEKALRASEEEDTTEDSVDSQMNSLTLNP